MPLKGFIILAVIAAGVGTASAKNATGVYLSAEDFQNARLTSQSECGSPGHKTELHDVLRKPYIEVTHKGETRRYEKSQIYGFRSCGGRDYRFVDKNEYEILESFGLTIYAHDVPARNPKDTSQGLANSRVYFFSIGAGGSVLPLTIEHLKTAFPDNHAFHDALDMTFHTDDELSQSDTFHHMFKINRLLIGSTDEDR
jgi:hypothetical protein